ncbi:MAG: hypothetical protein KAJ19_15965, partial [Gammaproteobacteria bacterium]|nr:hypothetical protein [Gammaproteobacteria bacterium]
MDRILSDDLVKALKIFENPKFLVTKNVDNEPNIALVMSWTVYEGDTLVYGDFMTYKTRMNLEAGNSEMSLLVMNTDLDSWLIKANFEGFNQNDEIYEFMAMTPLFRYNQYTNARAAGVARAIWASSNSPISKVSVLTSFTKAKLAKGRIPQETTEEGNMPPNVGSRFDRMAAVKAIAFVDDAGYPIAFPALGMMTAGRNRLVVNRGEELRRGFHIPDGQRVAVSLVTLEPTAFQVKGTFREINSKTGYIEVDRFFACS